jgi:hypothetical protein
VRYRVPLIIWGAHQGLEQVGMFSHEHEVEMTRRYRKDHDLMGREAEDLLSSFDILKDEDIWQYRYPCDQDLKAVGVRGIYLGNYVRWDPKAQHEQMMQQYGYRTSAFKRTFDCYDHVDCYNYLDLHDLLKLYKHGYSKVTDHASREIRFGRLTRAQGLALVRSHEQAPLTYLAGFCNWLGATPKGLQFLIDRHRNPRYWREPEPGRWEFRGWSTLHGTDEECEERSLESASTFLSNDTLEHGADSGYITVGKGWP